MSRWRTFGSRGRVAAKALLRQTSCGYQEAASGNEFVIVGVLLGSISGEIAYSPAFFVALDDAGRQYETTFLIDCGEALNTGNLTSAANTKGFIYFEVPLRANLTLVMRNILSDEIARMDL